MCCLSKGVGKACITLSCRSWRRLVQNSSLRNKVYHQIWFLHATNKTLPILWQHLPQSEICDLYPGIKPILGGKDRVPRCIVFSHVPPSCCESQYDLSERVRGKWADRCQLLYPGAGEDPRACQRASPRRWRLPSMLRMTAMKGYTLNNKVNDPPEMFFFCIYFSENQQSDGR